MPKEPHCIFKQPAVILGRLYQVGHDAIQKELDKLAWKEGIDLAYYGFKMTIEWYEKQSGTFKILRTYRLDNPFDIDNLYEAEND